VDVNQALTDAENSLRDFIASVLSRKLGSDWIEKCGVSSDRVAKWKERKATEAARQVAGVVDERLIYYADFYDLPTILQKNWNGEFAEAFGEWRTMDVYLGELGKIRDPDAHRRGLLQHQEQLAFGIAGTIRTLIVRHRSRMETADDCFPRIESAHDNYGNVWSAGPSAGMGVHTSTNLRLGDALQLFVTARDPEDLALTYGIMRGFGTSITWQQSSEFEFTIEERDIGTHFSVTLFIKSSRSYHAQGNYDDAIKFWYTVLPPKRP